MVGVMKDIYEQAVVVAAAAPLFDATEYVRGNGYRSLLSLIQIFVEKTVSFYICIYKYEIYLDI